MAGTGGTGPLPRTGAAVLGVLAAGAAAVAAGTGLVVATRRRGAHG